MASIPFSMVSNNATEGPPVRVLSLDGGGVRGLSSVIILKQIMERVNGDRSRRGFQPVEPWQVFDLIGGTSTGGIIAVMLGRLRMSLDDCERAYLELSRKIFTPRRAAFNINRVLDVLLANGKFDSKILEEAIKACVKNIEGTHEALLYDTRPGCKVFVVTSLENDQGTTLLRSYTNDRRPERTYIDCKIWEACRATSAASTFFDPIRIGAFDQLFIDGGIGCNNPIWQVQNEAREVFPSREPFILSIGAGCAPDTQIAGHAITAVIKGLKATAVETEITAENFLNAHEPMVERNLLFRFNVNQGLKEIGLEEYKEISKIAGATQIYLKKFDVHQKLEACVNKLLGLLAAPDVSTPLSSESDLHLHRELFDNSETQSLYAASNLRRNGNRSVSIPTPIASPNSTSDLRFSFQLQSPSESRSRLSMPISPPHSLPGSLRDNETSPSPAIGYLFPTLHTASSDSIPNEEEDGNSRPSTSTIMLNQLALDSRLTISSTSSLPPLSETASNQESRFNTTFLLDVREGGKVNSRMILHRLRKHKVKFCLEKDTLNKALLILSKNFPAKGYGGQWIQILTAVLDSSADLEYRDERHGGFTALMWAIWHRHYRVVELLIERGASLTTRDLVKQRTPLLLAAERDSSEAAITIVNRMDKVDSLDDMDKYGNTALAIAITEKATKTARILRKAGAR